MERLIEQEVLENQIYVMTLDRKGSSANILDRRFFREFNLHLDRIEAITNLRGLIIKSAKPSIFIAGADLNAFNQNLSVFELQSILEVGQDAFNRLAKLKITTVCAIHGMCLGGGLELALACDYRVATESKVTKLGLPEVNLGILPAWGGCSRLPRLIGLPLAMTAVLSGKIFPAVKAKKMGMVDALAYEEGLMAKALTFVEKKKARRKARSFVHSLPVRSLISSKAKANVMKLTRGNYPAPLKALEVLKASTSRTLDQSLEAERIAFLELVEGSVCKNLIRLFFLQERSKKLSLETDDVLSKMIVNKAAVLGAGVMGSGIAQWISSRKIPVFLKDIDPKQMANGLNVAKKIFDAGQKRRVFSRVEAVAGMDRITPVMNDSMLHGADLVVEAIVEKLDVKRKVFSELENHVSPWTILATNTSAISISIIAEGLKYPERLLGLHFFNPVHKMKLVEIIRGKKTSNYAVAKTIKFVKQIGKMPVVVADSPGFLVNRILMPYLFEAIRLFEMGNSIEDIDKSMLAFGMPMGPLRLLDEVGIDVSQHVAEDLIDRLESPFAESDFLKTMMKNEFYGKKNGKGFYVFDRKKKGRSSINKDVLKLRKMDLSQETDMRVLVHKMALLMVNEAARCLDEQVVESPKDVDFGMVMGTGWSPFRGGPLRYADDLGIDEVVRLLESFARNDAPHFEPCDLLKWMAKSKVKFYKETFYHPLVKGVESLSEAEGSLKSELITA